MNAMYECDKTEIRSVVVGFHQGSVLSPYLFNIIMGVMCADYIVLCDTNFAKLKEKLEKWIKAFERREWR